ncbi:glutamine amidotransferase-related protein [Streptomyces cadmiisoli]
MVDAEDTFTAMLHHRPRSLGLAVTVRRFGEPCPLDDHDLVVPGPGPGDPRDTGHPKAARLRAPADTLPAGHRPFPAVCFSHQVLRDRLGFELVRRKAPDQGTRREIDLFGARESVGFHNPFAARSREDKVECEGVGTVEVSRDRDTVEVHAPRGPRFASVQFHAESVLTRDGGCIIAGLLADLV